MKRIGYLLGISGLILGLAACGNNASDKDTSNNQNRDASSAKMQNSSSTKSTSSSSKDPQKKPHKDLTNYRYRVPAADRHSSNYTKNGNLTKTSQYTFDNFGTKQQLSKINEQPTTLTDDNVVYKIVKAKVIKNTPKTAEAKQAVAQTLNLQSVPNQYYTFVINYTVTNKQNATIALNGINSVQTDQGNTLAVNNQLTDSSAGHHLTANETETFTTVGYLQDYRTKPTNKVTINFGAIYDLQGTQISPAPAQGLNVSLQ
ncbi:hypothetical protein [Lentilactobacillus sp. SPB1-3]|uniref:Uncharacterized protein n=1 Tax=Lentilactobacillus terminaliae TaxID=3003483 RepID=A0ACD5DDE3_9LACO|nr:hypothetical protein [Lentilactobacillus sp. SPB1-3]MCZ0977892.1 hypothetical protein [Lentilactobacillus sp. SPB1-3]